MTTTFHNQFHLLFAAKVESTVQWKVAKNSGGDSFANFEVVFGCKAATFKFVFQIEKIFHQAHSVDAWCHLADENNRLSI